MPPLAGIAVTEVTRMSSFSCRVIRVLEDQGTLLVAFADDEPPQRYLLLQRALETPTDRERDLGLDRVHVSTEKTEGEGRYGGIHRVELSSVSLRLGFTAEASRELGLDESLIVDLSQAAMDTVELERALNQALAPLRVTRVD